MLKVSKDCRCEGRKEEQGAPCQRSERFPERQVEVQRWSREKARCSRNQIPASEHPARLARESEVKAEAQSEWVWQSHGEDRKEHVMFQVCSLRGPTWPHCLAGSGEGGIQTMSSGQPSPLQVAGRHRQKEGHHRRLELLCWCQQHGLVLEAIQSLLDQGIQGGR